MGFMKESLYLSTTLKAKAAEEILKNLRPNYVSLATKECEGVVKTVKICIEMGK
jgi:hypothetical protein